MKRLKSGMIQVGRTYWRARLTATAATQAYSQANGPAYSKNASTPASIGVPITRARRRPLAWSLTKVAGVVRLKP